MRAIARATRTENAGHVGGTFALSHAVNGENILARMPRLPIDHVLIPEGAALQSVERRPRLGSDHHGIKAGFALGVGG